MSHCPYLLLTLLFSMPFPKIGRGLRDSFGEVEEAGFDTAGLKCTETRRSVGDASVPDTPSTLVRVQVNRKRWRVSVCIMCMHACMCVRGVGCGGWAQPLRAMALHRVYTAYLSVNLQRPRSAQTAYGGRPVRPRPQMPDTHLHECTYTH